MNITNKIQQLLSLFTCFLLVLAVSIRRDGKVWGHDLQQKETVGKQEEADTIRMLDDGTIVVNTTYLAKDVIGYAGPVPLEISVKDGKVSGVKALKNSETPAFFSEASQLLDKWNGKTLEEASRLQVDAVSGATYTSKAIISNVRKGVHYAATNKPHVSASPHFDWSARSLAGLVVVLMAAILPLFIKNKHYRLFQQVLNVAVLGFWCGSFLNYTHIISYLSNGINVLAFIVPVIMLVTAFVYPLFGKKSYYCTHVCPFGSLQELAGRCVGKKLRMSPVVIKRLDMFRQILWAVLMFCLWTGLWFDWIDYEPFSAFVLQSASWVVITIAIVFVALSTVVMRPYCCFVCPTGSLLKFSQYSETKSKKK